MVQFEYNKPVQVTERQYKFADTNLKGYLARRIDEYGYYWVKLMSMRSDIAEWVTNQMNMR